jgi:hypothetical protein
MPKKNHSIFVDINKIWNFLKDNKIYVIAIILLLLTIRLECGWKQSKFDFNLQCNPLSVREVKELVIPVVSVEKE